MCIFPRQKSIAVIFPFCKREQYWDWEHNMANIYFSKAYNESEHILYDSDKY